MNLEEIQTALVALGIEPDSFGGWCPVQVSGRYCGRYLYFRARGDGWQLAIHDTEDLAVDLTFADDEHDAAYQGGFLRMGGYGQPQGYEAGYMPMEIAIELIKEALKGYPCCFGN
jgi:hypothetical protein